MLIFYLNNVKKLDEMYFFIDKKRGIAHWQGFTKRTVFCNMYQKKAPPMWRGFLFTMDWDYFFPSILSFNS